MPRSTLKKFAEYDLINGEYVTATVPLSQRVDEFETWLTATKARHGFARSPLYISNTMGQVRHLARERGFHFWTDVSKAVVETCLGRLGRASKTYNGYLASFKLFGDWMVENGRAADSPVRAIKPVRWMKTEGRRLSAWPPGFLLDSVPPPQFNRW